MSDISGGLSLRHITAYEHERLSVGTLGEGSAITEEEADQLALIGELRTGFCERGYRSIRLKQYCGVVRLGDRILEVLPKVRDDATLEESRSVLVRLLNLAGRFPYFQHLAVGQQLRNSPLHEVFIAAFFDEVTRIVKGGLLREYRSCEEDLPVVRGRIMVGRQFGVLSNRTDRVACQFEDISADNIWNQLIKLGLRVVGPWITGGDLYRRWSELTSVFDGVSVIENGTSAVKKPVFDRRAARYRVVMEWVDWILALLAPSLRAGEHNAPSLLFNMNALFESAVGNVLARRCEIRLHLEITCQDRSHHLGRISGSSKRAFPLRPDIVLRDAQRVVAIADVKWKVLRSTPSGSLAPSASDIYQLQAYADGFGCNDVLLIYPWHSDMSGTVENAFELSPVGNRVTTAAVVCLDLSSDYLVPVGKATDSKLALLLAQN